MLLMLHAGPVSPFGPGGPGGPEGPKSPIGPCLPGGPGTEKICVILHTVLVDNHSCLPEIREPDGLEYEHFSQFLIYQQAKFSFLSSISRNNFKKWTKAWSPMRSYDTERKLSFFLIRLSRQ